MMLAVTSPALSLLAPAQKGRVLSVGPDNALRTLAPALRLATPGDTIQLQAGTHAGAVGVVAQPGLTLRGLGSGATLAAHGQHAEGKAILVVRAADVRIENLEFRGARVPHGNGAGIRFESGTLTLDDCRFFDNEMGLLTGGRADMRLVVRGCTFADAPRHDSGQLHHLLYVGGIDTCVVMHSRFGNGFRGHLLKSRARVNRILWNELIDGPDGEASYELEFPNGGDNVVLGNRIEQSPRSHNAVLLSMGAEGGPPGARLVMRGNRFGSPARDVQIWHDRLGGAVEVQDEDNVFGRDGVRS